MNLSKSFLASLAVHLLILALALVAFKTVRSRPLPETKIRVALLMQAPASVTQNLPKPIASIPQPPQIPLKIPEKIVPSIKPVETQKPIAAAPAAVNVQKTAPVPAVVTHSEPTSQKTPMIEPVIAKAPPPPPAPNVQAEYEEANLGRIRTLLSEHLKYPKNALRLRQQGSVTITFTLSPSGEISALSITKSSEFELLDDAARSLIGETASLFPKPSKSVRISVPIEYKIR